MQLGTGTLSRVVRDGVHASNMRIAISPPTESEIHLLIDDGSNPPLEIIRISALMAELPVIFFESGGGAMIARYGNRTMQAPAYDLEALRTSIDPAKLPDAAWGEPRAVIERPARSDQDFGISEQGIQVFLVLLVP